MRLTIKKRKKHDKIRRNVKFIALFIITPLVCITLGWNLTKLVVVPYLRRDSVAAEEKLKNGKELKQMSLYNIEVARFSSFEDSEKFLRQLNNENLFAYVSKLEDYVIYVCLTFEKKDAEDRIVKVKEKYPNAKINSINIDPKRISVEPSEKNLLNKVLETVVLLNDSYRTEMSFWLGDMKTIDYKSIKAEMEKNNKAVRESMASYTDVFLSEGIESQELRTLYLMISQNLETRKKVIDEFDTEDIEYVKKTYYDFIKTLFTYINYYNM